MEKPPVLITLTAPTAAGKSHLFNYIRDIAELPCLISTTTRLPRAGEIVGVNYFYITEEESKRIEQENGFAELAIFRGVRYGVTWKEWHSKLQPGKIAFLIVEPSGIDHYVKPALDVGAIWLKYYIHTDPEVRYERFKSRALDDLRVAAEVDNNAKRMGRQANNLEKCAMSYMDRLVAMYTEERKWGTATHWTRTLFGDKPPSENLHVIARDVELAHALHAEQHKTQARF